MKLFYRLPSNIYINDIGTSLNYYEMEKSRQFEIHILRDTVTNQETKFISFTTWQYGTQSNRYFPYDIDFLRENFYQIYLEKSDGSYSCKLRTKVREDGKRYGYPLQTCKYLNSSVLTYSGLLTCFDNLDMETVDGKYCIYYSSVGCYNDSSNYVYARQYPLTFTSKNVVKCVLTESENYRKQLGVYKEVDDKCVYHDGIEFWWCLNQIQNNFYNPETNAIDFKLVIKDFDTSSKVSNAHYYIESNKLVWQSDLVQPPQGYEPEYDINTGEQWKATNRITTDYNIYRLPPWNGSKCIYVFAQPYYPYFKLTGLATVKYDEDENKWFIYNGSGLKVYECNSQVEYFDNTQTYHFDFIGTLSEDDRPEIADGLDLSFYTNFPLTKSFMSIAVKDGYQDKLKKIIEDHKKSTGFSNVVVFEKPVFI